MQATSLTYGDAIVDTAAALSRLADDLAAKYSSVSVIKFLLTRK